MWISFFISTSKKIKQKNENPSSISNEDIDELIKYVKKIVEHPQKSLLDKENPPRQEKLLELLYDGLPTYSELDSGTPQLSFVFMTEKEKSTIENSTFSQLGSMA